MPTISASRNVPVRGNPSAGPVSASTSSMLSPCSSISVDAVNITATPMRLAIKFGVSFAKTTCLPRVESANARKCRHQRGVALRRRNDFEKLHVARRIEKMRAEEPVAMRFQTRGDLCNWQTRSVAAQHRVRHKVRSVTRSRRARLISRFSATASITQSHCFSLIRSSSKFPGVIMDASEAS